MDLRVDVSIPNPQASIDAGFTFITVWRSDNGRNGNYYEISFAQPPRAFDERIQINNRQNCYVYHDQDGSAASWYKIQLFNPTSSTFGGFSDAIQGDADNALDILSIEEFKTVFLFGVDLSKDDGEELPDAYHEFYIKSAVSFYEQRLDLALRAKTIEAELHDYIPYEIPFFKLHHHPVQFIDSFEMIDEGGTCLQSFDPKFIQLDKESGQINVSQLSGRAGLFPFASHFRPHAFRVKYRVGFKNGEVPADIRELVGKTAAYGPLNAIGDLVGGAGVSATSLSIDGLSQSLTTTNTATMAGYGARIILYRKEINEQIKIIRAYYSGVKLSVA